MRLTKQQRDAVARLERRIENDPQTRGTVLVIRTPRANVARVMSVHPDRLQRAYQHCVAIALPTSTTPVVIADGEFTVVF